MGSHDQQGLRATFSNMADSTAEDWKLISAEYLPFGKALPERVLAHLKLLSGDYGGFAVDRMTHSLQTATSAHRAGKDEEYVVCALLHDIGDTLGHTIIRTSAPPYSNPSCPPKITGWWKSTASSKAIFSSNTLAWTATCASNFAAIRALSARRNFARNTTVPHSIPAAKRYRWISSNPWCGASLPYRRTRFIKARATCNPNKSLACEPCLDGHNIAIVQKYK